ncbi:MAG: DegV family protein [Bacillaceae bacterium]
MIKIVSDSSTLYSMDEAKKKNVDITPLTVTINNKSYRELEDIQTEEFVEIIRQGHVPISSQPAIGEVVEMYNQYPEDEIINITLADGLSGTYNSACMAKGMVEHGESITVINSKTLCGPQRYLVDVAVKLAEANKTKSEIIEEIEALMETSQSFLIPHDFEYLVRGGRLSPLVGRVGSFLKLVPVMSLSEDSTRLIKFTTKRTFKKAIQAICDKLIADGVNEQYKVYITHACNEGLATEAKGVIMKNMENTEVEIKLLTPAFTTQGGPDCVAIQVIKKHDSIM